MAGVLSLTKTCGILQAAPMCTPHLNRIPLVCDAWTVCDARLTVTFSVHPHLKHGSFVPM